VTITVDATVGGAAANSFVTVAEADSYLEARLNSAAWTGTEPKKQAVIEATRSLSALAWQGNRADDTQFLSWPRFNASNPDGTSALDVYDDDVIPQRIKDATCELALEFLRAGTTDIANPESSSGVIEKTVGPLTTRWADPSQRLSGLARFPRVMALINPLLVVPAGQVRLVR
jgi:hypothetical protein